jgi:ABC-type dipeptide/oligopeptide/nickel transport system permease subunit
MRDGRLRPGPAAGTDGGGGYSAGVVAEARSRRWALARRRAGLWVGGSMVAAVCLAALAAWLSGLDPTEVDLSLALRGPSLGHPFGTDQFGRDVLVRVMAGAAISLKVGVLSRFIAVGLGVLVGAMAGYYGGLRDRLVMISADVVMAYPALLLLIAVTAAFPPSLTVVFLALGFVGWPGVARLVRSLVLGLREREFVAAARAVGAHDRRILVRHILPNCLGPIIVAFTVGMGSAVMAEASLSFLGLGAQPPEPSWGAMVSHGKDYLRSAPWLTIFPGAAIAFTVVGFNVLGDAIRDVLDPRTGGRGR